MTEKEAKENLFHLIHINTYLDLNKEEFKIKNETLIKWSESTETVIQALEQRINNQKIFAKEYEKISKQLNCEVKDNLEKSIALEQKDKEIAELRIKQISSNLNNYIKQKQKEDEQLYALNEGWKIELEKKDKEISELKEEINYWKEYAEGEAGLRKQIQEDYQEQMQELLESEE